MGFLNAKEAAEMSQTTIVKNSLIQRNQIESFITAAIRKGDFKIYYYDPLLTSVENELKSYGYIITDNSCQKDGTLIEIAWKDQI